MGNSIAQSQLGIDAPHNRRREARMAISIPIEVTGFAQDGKFFAETTVTADVSESGCSFRLQRGLERGGVLAIKVLAREKLSTTRHEPFLYQVIYAAKDARDWAIGAAKLQEESVWSVTAHGLEENQPQPSRAVRK